jgi:hypothetical protein
LTTKSPVPSRFRTVSFTRGTPGPRLLRGPTAKASVGGIATHAPEETEGGQIGDSVRAHGRDPRNRPRHDASDEEFVDGGRCHDLGIDFHTDLLERGGAYRRLVPHRAPQASGFPVGTRLSDSATSRWAALACNP